MVRVVNISTFFRWHTFRRASEHSRQKCRPEFVVGPWGGLGQSFLAHFITHPVGYKIQVFISITRGYFAITRGYFDNNCVKVASWARIWALAVLISSWPFTRASTWAFSALDSCDSYSTGADGMSAAWILRLG